MVHWNSKHVIDEMIPTFMCCLWILHPIWFELRDCRASSNQSARDGHLTSCKRQNYLHQHYLGSLKKQKNKIVEDDDVPMPDSHYLFEQKGKVWLPLYKEIPVPLNSLLDYNEGVKAKYFRDNTRMYGSMFQFTFISGSLLPLDGKAPKFAQLYIYDTANELTNRMRPFSTSSGATKPNEDVMKQLIEIFDETNIIVRLLECLVIGLEILIMYQISDLHPAFMAMQYPILFPYGDDGFHLDIKYRSTTRRRQTKRGCVTAQEYYAFVIQ
ncbi:hypothetical protein PTKIN_Ptkin08bG0086500 [Pterospermum kingtungense]